MSPSVHRNVDIRILLLAAWVFLLTLHSYYFYQIGLALPPFVASIIAAICCLPYLARPIETKVVIVMRPILYIFAYLISVSVLASLYFFDEYYWRRLFALPLYIFSVYYFVILFCEKKMELGRALRIVLYVHLSFFFIQFLAYYLGGVVVDFISPFTGESQRILGGSYTFDVFGGGSLARPSGLFNEPGTYTCYTFLLYVMYRYFNYGDIATGKISVLDYLYFFSVILSFSVFGYILFFIYIGISVLRNIKNNLLLVVTVSALLPMLAAYYFIPRFLSGNYNDTGIEFRSQILRDFWNYSITNDFWNFAFGTGFFSDVSPVFGDLVLNDLGLLFFWIFTFGIFGVVVVVIGLRSGNFSIGMVSAVVLLICTKVSPTSFFFWIFLAFISIISHERLFQHRAVKGKFR